MTDPVLALPPALPRDPDGIPVLAFGAGSVLIGADGDEVSFYPDEPGAVGRRVRFAVRPVPCLRMTFDTAASVDVLIEVLAGVRDRLRELEGNASE